MVAAWEVAVWRAMVLPKSAAQVEKARPWKASAQNGMASRQSWERPRHPHARLRFRWNDGTATTARATTLASPAGPVQQAEDDRDQDQDTRL